MNGIWCNILCTYKLFTCFSMQRNRTGERLPLWCTELIFVHADGECFVPPVMVHHCNYYTHDIYYNIPSYWLVHHSLLGYMDLNECLKSMSHLSPMCCYPPLNHQVLLCDGYEIHFDNRAFSILWRNHIQSFILKSGDSVHNHPNYSGPILNLNNMYGNSRMNCMSKHRTIKFTLTHMNSILVETWNF